MKTFSFFLLFALVTLWGCKRMALGPAEENTPQNNFELFWDDYDKHSAIIFTKNINWDSVYTVYQPQVRPTTSEEELWRIFTEMIEVFDDEHTSLENPETEEFYVSGSHQIEAAIEAFSKELIEREYLEFVHTIDTMRAPEMSYGKILNKHIGYIHIGDTDGYGPIELMDDILSDIGQLKAIIFDVRNNPGGRGDFANAITAAFAEETKAIFSNQTRNGPGYNDFDEKTFFFNTNDEVNQYLKPVIVLTDKFSVSGAEHITLYLKSNSHVTHIGDTTAGAFSSTSNQRFLPNGWYYKYPAQNSLTPEGISLDGKGLVPDVLAINTKADIEAGRDVVLERAIQYLFETYNIE
ncbi:MAG: S41 family peptidase [Bacteroidota bacterium]